MTTVRDSFQTSIIWLQILRILIVTMKWPTVKICVTTPGRTSIARKLVLDLETNAVSFGSLNFFPTKCVGYHRILWVIIFQSITETTISASSRIHTCPSGLSMAQVTSNLWHMLNATSSTCFDLMDLFECAPNAITKFRQTAPVWTIGTSLKWRTCRAAGKTSYFSIVGAEI